MSICPENTDGAICGGQTSILLPLKFEEGGQTWSDEGVWDQTGEIQCGLETPEGFV